MIPNIDWVGLRDIAKSCLLPLAGVLLVVVCSLAWATSCVKKQKTEAAAAVLLAQGREQATAQELAQSQVDLQAATAARQAQERANEDLKAKLAARPRPEPRPVLTVSAKQEELRARGVNSPLTEKEAEAVWNWARSSDELPPLTARLNAAEDLIRGQEREKLGLHQELAAARSVIQRQVALLAERNDQIRALNAQVAAGVKQEKIGKVEKALEIGAALVLGYVGGRASK